HHRRMIFHRHVIGVLTCALLCAFASSAEAGLKLCKRTSYVLYAATGYLQGVNAVTQGWSRLLPGACQMAIKEPLAAHGYFVYARTSLAHAGLSRAWGGSRKLCVKDADFKLASPIAARCPADDTFELPFAGGDVHR